MKWPGHSENKHTSCRCALASIKNYCACNMHGEISLETEAGIHLSFEKLLLSLHKGHGPWCACLRFILTITLWNGTSRGCVCV